MAITCGWCWTLLDFLTNISDCCRLQSRSPDTSCKGESQACWRGLGSCTIASLFMVVRIFLSPPWTRRYMLAFNIKRLRQRMHGSILDSHSAEAGFWARDVAVKMNVTTSLDFAVETRTTTFLSTKLLDHLRTLAGVISPFLNDGSRSRFLNTED